MSLMLTCSFEWGVVWVTNHWPLIKAAKIFPIVREWKLYHKFSSLKGFRFSLFYIKKRAFQVFSKESRQDFSSSKRLLNKCFFILGVNTKNNQVPSCFSFYYGHMSFGFNLTNDDLGSLGFGVRSTYRYFPCIHCGVNYFAYWYFSLTLCLSRCFIFIWINIVV